MASPFLGAHSLVGRFWKVPGSAHTGGINARPIEYQHRVIAFFDRALLESKASEPRLR